MGNELDSKFGTAITLQFGADNVLKNATTDLTLAKGGTGFKVPAGYSFHPVCINAQTNADISAGSETYKVIDNGTELLHGPEAVLSDEVQAASGVQQFGVDPIPAGHVVGVSVTTSADLAPETGDKDVVLIGYLVPA